MENLTPEEKAEAILSILDQQVEIPENLVNKTVDQSSLANINIGASSKFSFLKYFQVAAVLTAAMFLGALLGKNADIHAFDKKGKRDKQALIEFRKQHHLSDDYTFGKL